MQAAAFSLPALRADLTLLPGAAAENGAPTWLIHDVSRNRYFRLGLDAFLALGQWQAGMSSTELIEKCSERGIHLDAQDLDGLLQFMLANQLLLTQDPTAVKRLLAQHERSRQHWFKWLLHHYLFIRIPLWRPDAFLQRTWPVVRHLLHPAVLWSIRALGVIGILLALQQWDVFVSTFLHFLTWEGLALYGLTLGVVKTAHELGHAYVARRYGCRVGSIGLAFMVLFPVLYTDTTDAWRLRSSRDRLRIVLAGVGTEIHLAMLATLAWSLLPDGSLRSVAFFVATTSWITSVLVNISPFMRFDGYFAFSDLLQAENLQPRAFALARWHLREMLFGFSEDMPEHLPHWRSTLFIAYAYATWLYRLFLFLGIALLVYHFAFKLLGIVLFVIEIAWFVLLPMKNELLQWWQRRKAIRLNRHTLLSLIGLLALLVALSTPWRSTVSVPAVLLAGEFQPLYAPERGRVLELLATPGDLVEVNRPLIRLESPELSHAIAQTQRELALVDEKIQRQAGSFRDLQDTLILSRQRIELQTRIESLMQRQSRLTLRAPMDGRVSQMESLQTGQWVSEHAPLISLRSEEGLRIMALIPAQDLHRVEAGAQARWISNLPGSPKLQLQLTRIDETALSVLKWPELASDYGGPVPVRKDAHQQLRPEGSWYLLELVAKEAQQAPAQQQAGQVLIEGHAESLLSRYWKYAAAVWVRESGF